MYTSYFSSPELKKHSEFPSYSIARYTPSGFKGNTLIQLAPPEDLLKWYKSSKQDYIAREQYTERYLEYLESIDIASIVYFIESNAVLLCYEKPESFCHRHILAKVLNEYGYLTTEL